MFFNRLIVAFPDGKLKYYDKRHLFSYANEHEIFTSGSSRLVFDYKGFKICPLVCYDLRFPVWSRNTEDIDVLIYVANWPKPRIKAWDILLKARAIENLSYVVGVNRVGDDGNKVYHSGDSAIIHPNGTILSEVSDKEAIITQTISKKELNYHRHKLPYLLDRDKFKIILD